MSRLLPLALAALIGAAAMVGIGRHDAGAAPQMRRDPPLIQGFFAGRPVTYLLTDVSTAKDARALSKATKFPVTFAPKLARVPESTPPSCTTPLVKNSPVVG